MFRLSSYFFHYIFKTYPMIRALQVIIIFFVSISGLLKSQTQDSLTQSSIQLEPIEIIANFNKQPLLGLTTSAELISEQQIVNQQSTTFLPALNAVPGIRMEERSPGSYRLAMRGSLIRSPFGVRNIKIYIDEFPITDAGGNTYLNLLDPASIASIHILKGPDGSLYGANSGGVLRLQPKGFNENKNQASLLLSGGSFGLLQEQLSVQRKLSEKYSFSVDQSLTRSDGYRENSALNKKTFQTAHNWKYSTKNELRFLALYSDLKYQTPGGLTFTQMQENPRMARPATGPNPSASEQKAGIHNKTFFGGIAHQAQLTEKLLHSVSLFGMYTDFENPFITNYEYRTEKNLGVRTYFSYKNQWNENLKWQMQLGFEGQKGWNNIDNYDNHAGLPGVMQAKDDLDNVQNSFFYRAMLNLHQRWTIETSMGLNHAKIKYNSRYPEIENSEGEIEFGNIWMPKIATSYLILDNWSIRASVSKGYSPPTIAEVRSSDNIINTDLAAENGVNYEMGSRWESINKRFGADLSLYHYKMKNGIVRKLRDNGAEFYVNAGEINQDGMEMKVWTYIIPYRKIKFLQFLHLNSAVSYNHYRFENYKVNEINYSENKLTAVPDWVWTNSVSLQFTGNLGLNFSHNFTSSMPLNDANTVFADKFHLVQLKGFWNWSWKETSQFKIFVGVDNLLNQQYSLGNDINAFGNRFFNPAPSRNYYAGIKMSF